MFRDHHSHKSQFTELLYGLVGEFFLFIPFACRGGELVGGELPGCLPDKLVCFRIIKIHDEFLPFIFVESPARFSAKHACGNHFLQKRTRPVLGIAKAVVKDLHNREADVEADKIGQR